MNNDMQIDSKDSVITDGTVNGDVTNEVSVNEVENGENSEVKSEVSLEIKPEVFSEVLPKEIQEKYPPTTIVLAKVKGYPEWPAMVLEESILPEYVMAKKPKIAKIKRKVIYHLPVRFFSDDTYIWIKTDDVKILSLDLIDDFLESPKKRKDKLLQNAYTLAKDPLDMETFAKYGSRGEPAPEPEYEEDLIEVVAPKRRKPGPKPKPKANTKTGAKPGPKPGPKKQKTVSKVAHVEEQDPDWGLDEDIDENYELGNYIFEDQQEQIEFMNTFPESKVIVEEYNKINEKFNKLSVQVFRAIGNEQDLIETLHKLSKMEIPKSISTKSKVFKLLVALNRSHDTSEHLRNEINKLLILWGNLQVDENPETPIEATPLPESSVEPDIVEIHMNGDQETNGHHQPKVENNGIRPEGNTPEGNHLEESPHGNTTPLETNGPITKET